MKKTALFSALAAVFLMGLFSAVFAQWAALAGSGYAVTTNVHGTDIPPFMQVTATAGTLNSEVVQVTFRWHRPNGTIAREATVPVFTNGTKETWKTKGITTEVRYAIDAFKPDTNTGDWGVQAFFQDATGTQKASLQDVIQIRATSFNVVPEIAFGTIGAAAVMFVALGLFAFKRKKNQRV